jgi:hypothetical protein
MPLAPTYRNLDARTTVLGLAFPGELVLVMAVFWAGMLLLPPAAGAAVSGAAYLAVRLVGRGKPPGHFQHLVVRKVRAAASGGRLSAAARARVPRFPFSPYEGRDR